MTISTDKNKILYSGDGVTLSYIYDFLVPITDNMQVLLDEVEQTTGYTVLGAGDDEGGSVVFDVAPGDEVAITLIRELPIVQEMDLTPYDAFPAESVEDAFDRQTMVSQDLQEQISRTVKSPTGDDGSTDVTLPLYQAGAALTWDVTEKKLVNSEFPLDSYIAQAAQSADDAALAESGAATSANTAQLKAWDAEAEEMTAASYSSELEDVHVNVYTSNGDGTFTATVSGDYSAYHWAEKAKEVDLDAGEINTATSAGAGESIVLAKVGVDLPFKSFTASGIATISGSADEVNYDVPSPDVEEAPIDGVKYLRADAGWVPASAVASANLVVMTSSGTYTRPSNLLYADISVVGGGGGGGGVLGTGLDTGMAGGGGGGAATGRSVLSVGQISTGTAVTVGVGGAGGGPGADGLPGATSSFGATITADGGGGGQGGTATALSNGTIRLGGPGGELGTADLLLVGGPGGLGICVGSGSLEVGSGFGGSSSIGGGHTSVNTDSTGQPSAGLGGGGSGASVINNTEEHFGGAGGAGAVVITEYLS